MNLDEVLEDKHGQLSFWNLGGVGKKICRFIEGIGWWWHALSICTFEIDIFLKFFV